MENSGKMELAFMNLKPSYIIFICTFDPFGKGLYRYTFKPRCEEADLYLEDGTQRIFLNTKGNNASDISDELLHFLRYVEQSTTEVARTGRDEVVPRIHKRVQNIKRDRKLEVGYMYLQEYIDAEKALAREEGLAEGHAEGKSELVLEFLSEIGEVPDEIAIRVKVERDLQVLRKWVKTAARAKSIEEFRTQM